MMDIARSAGQNAVVFAVKSVTCLAICLAFGAKPAAAHAILLDSQPPARARLAPGPVVFTLHYNSRLDHARSRLTLVAPDRTETRLPIDDASAPDGLTTKLQAAPGAWTIRWQVLALDGHITRGDVPFQVTAPP